MNILIPRCIGETSIPYCLKEVKKKFGINSVITLICRRDEEDLFKTIKNIDFIEVINTKKFGPKTKIIKNLIQSNKNTVIIPISSLKTLNNYNNVIKFIDKKISYKDIYIYSFDTNQITKLNNTYISKLKNALIGMLSIVVSIPIYLFIIIFILFKYVKFLTKRDEK